MSSILAGLGLAAVVLFAAGLLVIAYKVGIEPLYRSVAHAAHMAGRRRRERLARLRRLDPAYAPDPWTAERMRRIRGQMTSSKKLPN